MESAQEAFSHVISGALLPVRSLSGIGETEDWVELHAQDEVEE